MARVSISVIRKAKCRPPLGGPVYDCACLNQPVLPYAGAVPGRLNLQMAPRTYKVYIILSLWFILYTAKGPTELLVASSAPVSIQ